MSEIMTNEQQTTEDVNSSLAAAIWADKPAATETVETTPVVEEKKEEEVVANPLKDNLGYDDWEQAKNEIAELKKAKEAPEVKPLKLQDVLSEKEDEIYEVLSKKKEFKRIEKLDVTNPKDAAELIKANLKLKYKDLDASEVEDMFNEQYAIYSKPKQTFETDEEYDAIVAAWKEKSEATERKMIRDAKIAKPEVISLQSQIVYPDIPINNEAVNTEPSKEDLEAFEKTKTSFIQSAETFMKSFNGFSATVKDKDVEIPVSYELSKEEKTKVDKVVKDFAENGFNANSIFAERWLNQDGSINTERVVRDFSLLFNEERISQKYVNDAASKRLEAFLKEKKNVSVNGTSGGQFTPGGEKTELQEVQEWIWNT